MLNGKDYILLFDLKIKKIKLQKFNKNNNIEFDRFSYDILSILLTHQFIFHCMHTDRRQVTVEHALNQFNYIERILQKNVTKLNLCFT